MFTQLGVILVNSALMWLILEKITDKLIAAQKEPEEVPHRPKLVSLRGGKR